MLLRTNAFKSLNLQPPLHARQNAFESLNLQLLLHARQNAFESSNSQQKAFKSAHKIAISLETAFKISSQTAISSARTAK